MPLVRIPNARLTLIHAVAIGLLALAHFVTQWLHVVEGRQSVYGLVEFFDLANEGNLPTFFSIWQLLLCAAVLAIIATIRTGEGDPFRWHWTVLAAVTFYLAVDESAQIHELLIRPMRDLMPGLATGLLYWTWVVPGLIGVTVAALAYRRFTFTALPRDIRWQLIGAATLFVIGALGVEMLGAAYFQQHGQDNLAYAGVVLLEEALELSGVLVALNALIRHWSRDVDPITLAAGR